MGNPLIHRPRKRFAQDRSPILILHVTQQAIGLYSSIDAIFGDSYSIPAVTLSL